MVGIQIMLKNVAVTTYADDHGGGTSSAWFDTDEEEITDKLIGEFYTRFPTIKAVHSVTLMSKERVNGFAKTFKFWNDWSM